MSEIPNDQKADRAAVEHDGYNNSTFRPLYDPISLLKEGAKSAQLFAEGVADGLIMTPINGVLSLATGKPDLLHFTNQMEEDDSVSGSIGMGVGILAGAAVVAGAPVYQMLNGAELASRGVYAAEALGWLTATTVGALEHPYSSCGGICRD